MNTRKILHNFTCVLGTLRQVEVVKKQYVTGDIALYIEAVFQGKRETLLIASCLIPGIPPDCVAIKDFAENRGCLRELTNAGAIDDPHLFLNGVPICRVLF